MVAGHNALRRALIVALMVLTAGAAAALPASATGDGGGLQRDCSAPPAVFPVAELRPGMKAVGYTVIEGRTVSSFDVEIVAVLADGIAPDLDFIMVEVSGPAIDRSGGIAAGFSGSPVYIGGRLVGAVAYGFFGNPTLGGLTPAAAMVDVLNRPLPEAKAATEVRLSTAARVAAAGATSSTLADIPGSAQRLPLPVGVSGLDERGREALERRFADRGVPVALFPATGGGTPAPSPSGALLPGSSLAVALSYGDLALYTFGTTTLCHGDRVVGFGHPIFFNGETTLGLNAADVVTVLQDESGLGFAQKLATVAEIVGSVDRDHLAGIRGISGEPPRLIPITSQTSFPQEGRSRAGRTEVAFTDDLPFLAPFHLALNLQTVFDRFGPGTATIDWTVSGRRADGSAFELARRNKFWSPFDITFESIFEMESYLFTISDNPFEEVEISAVDITTAELSTRRSTAEVKDVRVWSSTDPTPQRTTVVAAPGDTVTVEATLRPFGAVEDRIVTLQLEVPAEASGFGSLIVRGGSGFFEGFIGGEVVSEEVPPSDGTVDSFDELLAELAARDHNNDLVAQLEFFPDSFQPGEEPSPIDLGTRNGPVPGEPQPIRVKAVEPQEEVVTGERFLEVLVDGFEPPPPMGGTLFATLTGAAEVPDPGDPDGSGTAVVDIFGEFLAFDIAVDGVAPVTAAHIHAGAAGEAGPVVIDFDVATNGLAGEILVDPALAEQILADPEAFYVNVHNDDFPAGALRGQLTDTLVAPAAHTPDSVGFVSSAGLWHLGASDPFYFGVPGDVPFLGDWDGDGVGTPGLYRPSDGFAYVRSSNDTGIADAEWFMGIPGDRPIVGDWDGDGTDTFGVYRPAEGKVYLRNSLTTGMADVEYHFGVPGDVPFAGDFDGDGVDEVGLHRPATGLVYFRFDHTSGTAAAEHYWGDPGDVVFAGDWDGDGIDTPGLVRSSAEMVHLRNSAGEGAADVSLPVAIAGARPVIG